jgi:hypothetical protein
MRLSGIFNQYFDLMGELKMNIRPVFVIFAALLAMQATAYSQIQMQDPVLMQEPARMNLEVKLPPSVKSIFCSPRMVNVYPKFYQIECITTGVQGSTEQEYSIWVIRRDGTAPDWAMQPQDFDRLQAVMLSPKAMISRGSAAPNGWRFRGRKNTRVPVEYCREGISCYDLVSYSFAVPGAGL